MSVSFHIHGTRKIAAEGGTNGACGGFLDLVILSEDGDVELTLHFDDPTVATTYAAAINGASNQIERGYRIKRLTAALSNLQKEPAP